MAALANNPRQLRGMGGCRPSAPPVAPYQMGQGRVHPGYGGRHRVGRQVPGGLQRTLRPAAWRAQLRVESRPQAAASEEGRPPIARQESYGVKGHPELEMDRLRVVWVAGLACD